MLDMQTWFDESVVPPVEVSSEPEDEDLDAERYEAIKTIIDKVGYALACDDTLSTEEKLAEWVSTLEWALEMLPAGYERTREIFKQGIEHPSTTDFQPSRSF